MILFLIKGLLRDRARMYFPLTVVSLGVGAAVILHACLSGFLADMIRMNAHFRTGHVKVTTRAYAEGREYELGDLSLYKIIDLKSELEAAHPQCIWLPRFHFGGLLDIPNIRGETRAQGPVKVLGVSLLQRDAPEVAILDLENALIRGNLPRRPGDILVSEDLAVRLGLQLGETATFIGNTAYGGITTYNFTFAGSIRFGYPALDGGTVIMDIHDAHRVLDLEDSAGEILGLFKEGRYGKGRSEALIAAFNARDGTGHDPFSPVMTGLQEQPELAGRLAFLNTRLVMALGLLTFIMFAILWNSGLMIGLKRYGEMGLRLAAGETRNGLYVSLLTEALFIGVLGSLIGTGLGLIVGFYLQGHVLEMDALVQNTMVAPDVIRARLTMETCLVGLPCGIAAAVLGAAASGLGIFRRDVSHLLQELEV